MTPTMNVPYVNLVAQNAAIKQQLLAAVEKTLDHSNFILGDEVDEFERRFAQQCGVGYAVGVNSGTDALILAIKALGIGPGDEVITVPNSFVASTSCIALMGAHPVFVDVGEDYNIDPLQIEAAITPRTRAIIPVHLTGRPAEMDCLLEIAQKHNLHIIEDSAQAVCAEYKGKRVGSFGTAGCFSLHPLKTLNACGDGGVLTTNDPKLYEQFKVLRNHGLRNRDECTVWSYNSRLDTIQAAILLVDLEYLEQWTNKRRANAKRYQQLLTDLPQVTLPIDKPHEKAVYHTFVIQAERRAQLKDYLSNQGIGTSIHYPIPIHLQESATYLGHEPGSFPTTERQADKILSLPVYPELEDQQIEYVTECIRRFYD